MKFNANDFTPAEAMKFIRQWTELTQEEFAQSISRKTGVVRSYEQGTRNYTFQTLLEIARIHNIKITIEKNSKL